MIINDKHSNFNSFVKDFFNDITMPEDQKPVAFLAQSRLYVALDDEDDEFLIENLDDERYLRISGGLKPYKAWMQEQFSYSAEPIIEFDAEDTDGKIKLTGVRTGSGLVYIGDSLGRIRDKYSTYTQTIRQLRYIVNPIIVTLDGTPIPGEEITLEIGQSVVLAFYCCFYETSGVSWQTSDSDIVSISATSQVFIRRFVAEGNGQVTITANGELGTEHSIKITVPPED